MSRRADDKADGRRRGPGPYVTCGAIATTILGLAAVKSRSDLTSAERTLATARAQVDVVTVAEEVAVDMQERIAEVHADIADYARLREAGAMAAVFTTLIDAVPESVALEGMSIESGPGEYAAEISGAADGRALALLRRELSRSFPLPRVERGGASNAPGGREPFRLHLRFDPAELNLSARDATPESVAATTSGAGS